MGAHGGAASYDIIERVVFAQHSSGLRRQTIVAAINQRRIHSSYGTFICAHSGTRVDHVLLGCGRTS